MVNNLQITLCLKQMKNINLSLKNNSYYLVLCLANEQKIISESTNILYRELFFSYREDSLIQSIQIWNYDTAKKAGTIYLKNYQFIENFTHFFKKYNLELKLKTIEGQIIQITEKNSTKMTEKRQNSLKLSKSTFEQNEKACSYTKQMC